MEKLIELFREYVNKYSNDTKIDGVEYTIIDDGHAFIYGTREYTYLYIISKQFGFIERLVENDKIDRDKILKEDGLFRMYFYDLEYVKNYDRLIMWLSVSDNPIEELCKYLKDDATEKVDKLLNGAKRTCENIGI